MLSFHNFAKLGPQHEFFLENFPKFSEELVLCNTTGQLFLNLKTIFIATTPYYHTCIWEIGEGGWGGWVEV